MVPGGTEYSRIMRDAWEGEILDMTKGKLNVDKDKNVTWRRTCLEIRSH